jgi:hypothetical protein
VTAQCQIMKVSYFAVPSNGWLAGTEVAAAIGQVHKLPPKGHNVLPAAQPSLPVVHVPSALRRNWLKGNKLGHLTVVPAARAAGQQALFRARFGEPILTEAFRRRALITGAGVGALSALGLLILHNDAPPLYSELTSGRALPFLAGAVLAGLASLVLLWRRAYLAVRITAALAVLGLLWGWGWGQYPELLPGTDLETAAATDAVLAATLVSLAIGALLLLPSLWWLYATSQREHPQAPNPAAPADPDADQTQTQTDRTSR